MDITVNIRQAAERYGITEEVLSDVRDIVEGRAKPRGKDRKYHYEKNWYFFTRFCNAFDFSPEEMLSILSESKIEEICLDLLTREQKCSNITDYSKDDTTSTAEASEQQQKKIKALYETIRNMQREIENTRHFTRIISDELISEFGRLEFENFKDKIRKPIDEEEADVVVMIDLSDWHAGSKWEKSDTGISEENVDTFIDKINILTEKVISLVNLQRRIDNISKLYVNFLGDIAENDNLHKSSGIYCDVPTIKQAAIAMQSAEYMLLQFSKEFDEIDCMCVYGNHGRIGKKGETHYLNNWDTLIYMFLAERFKNCPNVNFYISTTPYMAYVPKEQPQFVHCLIHGDGIPAPFSIPFYSVKRSEANISTMLNKQINYTHLAHWHNIAQLDKMFGAVFINGSLTGTSPYGASHRLFGQAKQLLTGYHSVYGHIWTYPIYLEKNSPPQADDNGIITPYVLGLE